MFRNILGTDVKLSHEPNELSIQNSFIGCAMKCDFSPDCESFNMRTCNTTSSLKIYELFNYKETDLFNQSNKENGSTYFEKVKCQKIFLN